MCRALQSLIASLVILAASAALADDLCELAGVEESMPSDHPVCLFYTGTQYFRDNKYAEAARAWELLRQFNDISSEHISLRISALNNLGYLYFAGLGVDDDKNRAVSYWREAVSFGHDESEYHLCYALGNPDEPTFEPVTARMHCNKADALYRAIEEPDDGDQAILEIVGRYKDRLE